MVSFNLNLCKSLRVGFGNSNWLGNIKTASWLRAPLHRLVFQTGKKWPDHLWAIFLVWLVNFYSGSQRGARKNHLSLVFANDRRCQKDWVEARSMDHELHHSKEMREKQEKQPCLRAQVKSAHNRGIYLNFSNFFGRDFEDSLIFPRPFRHKFDYI